MTSTEIKEEIGLLITTETTPNSITPAEVGGILENIVDYVDQESMGCKVFSALVSQSGTSIPTLKVLKNTTGVTFTASRSGVGNYLLTGSSNVFTTDKTACSYSLNTAGSFPNATMFFYSIGAQYFTLESKNSGTATDGILTDTLVKIEIYP